MDMNSGSYEDSQKFENFFLPRYWVKYFVLFRIIDARYAFEFEGGHIRGAENWQHGEDEEFLSAFLPAHPLPAPPPFLPDDPAKRDILIFHCEFSSQRGPDFYKKLRER